MHPPALDVCDIYRHDFEDRETYKNEELIYSDVPCLIAPANSSFTMTFQGRAEMIESLLFIDAAIDVKLGDKIVDKGSNLTYNIVEPPIKYKNPMTNEYDHWQCVLKSNPGG